MDKLKFINTALATISLPYEYGEWTQDVTYPYFVGEVSEMPVSTEDGKEESEFVLTGFHRGRYIDLEQWRVQIKSLFDPVSGLRGETDSGTIVVYYDGYMSVPTNETDLKRVQINLRILEWKGMN